MSRIGGGGRNPLDWNRSHKQKKISEQGLSDREEEKHNRSVERFLEKIEKRSGKKIERDWND
jgi:hypothetical protein